MSLYKQGVSAPAYGSRPPTTLLVKVAGVIPTPYGNAIAGEVVEGEYFPLGSTYEVGWSLKGGLKKLGKGVKKVGKTTFKVATTPHRLAYNVSKGIAKGAIKVTAKTGKTVFKGTKGAVNWVKKNPVKALALAVPPLGLSYAAYKGGKALVKSVVPKGSNQAALPAMEEEESSEAMPTEGPESYPGESYESEEAEQEQQADALDVPEPETDYSEDEGSEEESQDYSEDEGSEEGEGEEDADESAIEGETDMREEWVGLDEIAYDDDGDGVGYDEIAGPPRRPAGRPPGPNAVQVRQKGYGKARRQPMGFNSVGTIAAGASQTIQVVSQTLFRGRKLSVPIALAPFFTIDQLLVGNTPQFATAGAQSAEAFRSDATGTDNLTMDSCPPGLTITMTVTNQDSSAHAFRATLFGDSVQ